MIKAAPEEEERLRRLEIPTSEMNGKRYFAMPCQFTCEGRCGIYADRFRSCRSFRCKVLRDFESGAVTQKEAREKIATALRLRSEAAACDPAAVRLSERIRLRDEPARTTDNRRSELLLKMAALDYFLDMHFRTKKPQVVRGEVAAADHIIRP